VDGVRNVGGENKEVEDVETGAVMERKKVGMYVKKKAEGVTPSTLAWVPSVKSMLSPIKSCISLRTVQVSS
jgi:hypothetical protein